MTKITVNVKREGKAIILTDDNGEVLLKLHTGSEKTAQNKIDRLVEKTKA